MLGSAAADAGCAGCAVKCGPGLCGIKPLRAKSVPFEVNTVNIVASAAVAVLGAVGMALRRPTSTPLASPRRPTTYTKQQLRYASNLSVTISTHLDRSAVAIHSVEPEARREGPGPARDRDVRLRDGGVRGRWSGIRTTYIGRHDYTTFVVTNYALAPSQYERFYYS